jgi:Na+-translocating ferredoxin:NAD+ oxidoreductase subunit B
MYYNNIFMILRYRRPHVAEDIYRSLQQRLDMYSLGFPETSTSIELDILKRLFSEKDAELFLHLSPRLEEPSVVAERTGRSVHGMEEHLEDMASRGLLFRKRKGDTVKYGAIPFMHGVMEFQVKSFDRDLAEMLEQYYHDGLRASIAKSADLFMRTVPINQSVELTHEVASFEDACEIIRNADTIVVADCICRKEKDMLGKGCGKPMETCFMFGSMAEYYIENKLGRHIDAEEGIAILKNAQDAGMVTQPATAQNPSGMCSCCGDCCGVLQSIKMHPRPAEIVFSNHYAVVDEDLCTGCGSCLDRCQMEALAMGSDDLLKINLDRCIGCGLCVTECPTGALALQLKDEAKRRVPPVSGGEQMMEMAKKRGVL